MINNKKIGNLCILLFISLINYGICLSQDIKFSQYFSAPLMVNPALCGIYGGKYRIQSNYRSQWGNIQYPYTTATLSSEVQLQRESFQDDILAVGMNAFADKSNNGGLANNIFSGNVSYHKSLDANHYSRLGVGLQFSYNTLTLDFSKMTFEPQFTANGYNISLPINEPVYGFTTNKLDVGAGVLYSYFTGDLNIYSGVSFYHLNQTNSQYGNVSLKLPMRTTIHGGLSFDIGDMNTLYLNFMHMFFSQSSQTTIGVVYSLNLNGGRNETYDDYDYPSNEFFIGSWIRLNDAIVPYVGLKIGNVQGGLSYDITTSKLISANQGMGGLELSLNLLINQNPNKETLHRLKCKFMQY